MHVTDNVDIDTNIALYFTKIIIAVSLFELSGCDPNGIEIIVSEKKCNIYINDFIDPVTKESVMQGIRINYKKMTFKEMSQEPQVVIWSEEYLLDNEKEDYILIRNREKCSKDLTNRCLNVINILKTKLNKITI
jgi:hypothetical protein